MRHIAVIPARMGSVGFQYKNRKFFNYTADFVKTVPWFERTIVSTDDPVVTEYAEKNMFEVHKRPEELAGPAVSIHRVFDCLLKEMDIKDDDILWLFYLPVLFKNLGDFEHGKKIIESGEYDSVCTFVPVKNHPYNCWNYDPESKKLGQYVENDCFRRQDLPPAWTYYHYVYNFRASALDTLNSEMINQDTYPYFLSEEVRDKLIEIDTPEDYEHWKAAGCPTG
ncbi:MAG: hypothetical protein ACNI27_13985 [Desulfovibrio sp.]